MDNNENINTSAAAKDSSEMTDDYVQIFQPIMPDDWQTYDQKLDKAVERMVNDTIGDLPLHRSILKTSSNSNSNKTNTNKNSTSSSKTSDGKKHKMTGLKLFFILLAVVLVILGGIYYYYADFYKTHFVKGTFINGLAVDDMTTDQVTKVLADDIDKYNLEVVFRDGFVENIDGSDIDYHFVPGDTITNIMENQNQWLWFTGLLGSTVHNSIDQSIEYNSDMLKNKLMSSEEFDRENQSNPENAYIKQKGFRFVIVPETEGNKVDKEMLLELANEAVSNGDDSLTFDMEEGYKKADILRDDAELNKQLDDLNAFLDTTVTYDLIKDKKQVLDRKTTIKWVTQADDGYLYINTNDLTEKITEYVAAMAEKIDYTKNSRVFNSTKRGTVEVSCSTYGTIIDQPLEVEALYNNLIEKRTEEREPVYSRNDGEVDPTFGGHYIEVDIKNQHVYVYTDSKLVVDTDVVTGNVSMGCDTPKGVYDIYNKETNRILRGARLEDGSFEYETPVNYWMPFLRGYGLHDATWRGDFGGDIYVYGGSHGCVNLPLDKATIIYDNISVGTPVIVF